MAGQARQGAEERCERGGEGRDGGRMVEGERSKGEKIKHVLSFFFFFSQSFSNSCSFDGKK